ncbi:MAG TPA: SDR family oxidoreductase [Azospirillaceae bacterium]|nr:SDR family oxidoreductase [Azospirillaceae bacterium]
MPQSQPFDFSGRHVFVAGGTSGINLGVAEAFAAAGAKVSVISRSPEKVQAATERLRAQGAEAAGWSADVRDYAATEAALKAAHERFGTIDVLISGAAGNFPAPALGMSPNAFRSVIEIDVLGTYHVLRAANPFLARPGASVVNISAPQAFQAWALQSHVCAAKAGVDQITRTLAVEWGPDGIRVNSVVPGPIEGTEGMKRLAADPRVAETVTRAVPAGRMGTPADIAWACMFLSSPWASYITGVVLPVDGGATLGGPFPGFRPGEWQKMAELTKRG